MWQIDTCRFRWPWVTLTRVSKSWYTYKSNIWKTMRLRDKLTHCFRDIRLQKCSDLENQVRCPSWSLEITIRWSAYDFLLTFYSNYVSISCRFWDIQCWKISRPWNPGQGSVKEIESGTIRHIAYGFPNINIWETICNVPNGTTFNFLVEYL